MNAAAEAVPRIGVLAVQGDVREHFAALREGGAQTVGVRRPSELEGLDGIVLPGGESTTMDKLLRAFELFEPLRAAIAGGMPAYGSCAGMILLARRVLDGTADQQTLGGLDITVRRNAFGRQVDSFEADLPMPVLAEPNRPMHAVFIRAPWVEAIGPDVRVLATVPAAQPDGAPPQDRGGPAAGQVGPHRRVVAVRQCSVLATAFHPEVSGDHRVHAYFLDMVRESAHARREPQTRGRAAAGAGGQ